MKLQDRVTALREASNVLRCHTTVAVGRDYTVGVHSFNAANLLLQLHPDPSMNLLKAVLWHDVHERYMGDVPSPAIASDGELGRLMARLETRINRALEVEVRLSAEERMWLQAIDKAELLLWCKEQIAMGNQLVMTMTFRLLGWFAHNEIPDEVNSFMEEHKFKRLKDGIPE